MLTVGLLGTSCATKKYVTKTVAPVESRVGATESKNADQDKQIASQGTELGEVGKDLSRTKERLSDTDAKATAAGEEAKRAGDRAEGASKAADGARSLAEQGIEKTGQLEKTVTAMNKFQMTKSETVLFAFNQSKLTDDAKAQLDEFAKSVNGMDRYVIEVQGFTDKTGTPTVNEALSEQRAQEVARYLANEYKIPVRSISMLGSGYAQPVADDKTREGRKQNRRVEVRLFVPEALARTAMSENAGSAEHNNR